MPRIRVKYVRNSRVLRVQNLNVNDAFPNVVHPPLKRFWHLSMLAQREFADAKIQ